MLRPDPEAAERAAATAALFALHGADLRPGRFFLLARGDAPGQATARVHESDLTAAERAAVGLAPLDTTEPVTPPATEDA